MVSPTFGYAPVPALAAEAELGNDEQQQLQPSSTSTTTTTTHTSTTTTSSVEEDDPRSDTQGDFTCSSFPASTLPHHSRLLLCLVLAAVLAGLVLVGVIGVAVGFSFSLSSSHAGRSDLLPVTPGRILVVFVHLAGQYATRSHTHPAPPPLRSHSSPPPTSPLPLFLPSAVAGRSCS